MTYVDKIVPGFAADRSGRFSVGDTVHAIGGVSVQGYSLDDLKTLTIGPAGTTVTIDFSRGGQRYTETLVRRLPDYTDGSNADAANVLIDRGYASGGSRYGAPGYTTSDTGYGPGPAGYDLYGSGYSQSRTSESKYYGGGGGGGGGGGYYGR